MIAQDKAAALAAILKSAADQAGPLAADLARLMEAEAVAKNLGLGPGATAQEIVDAFAAGVDTTPPVRELIPSVLSPDAAESIRKAREHLLETHRTVGQSLGNVLGLIAGLAI